MAGSLTVSHRLAFRIAGISDPFGTRMYRLDSASVYQFVLAKVTAITLTRPVSKAQQVSQLALGAIMLTGRQECALLSAPTLPTPSSLPSTAKTPALEANMPTQS